MRTLIERFKYGVVISEYGTCLITSSLQMSISVVKVTRNSQSDGFSVLWSVRHPVKQLTVDLGWLANHSPAHCPYDWHEHFTRPFLGKETQLRRASRNMHAREAHMHWRAWISEKFNTHRPAQEDSPDFLDLDQSATRVDELRRIDSLLKWFTPSAIYIGTINVPTILVTMGHLGTLS